MQTTVLDGVYSERQASRGARHYRRICAECHEGAEPDGDPLIGPVFIERWREESLAYLYDFISTEMPGNDAGGLPESSYLEVMAFLLSANDYPAGETLLSRDMLEGVLFTGHEGPRPLPSYSLVKAVGCLVHPAGEAGNTGDNPQWRLKSSTRPLRVRGADETDDEELAASGQLAPGSDTFVLHRIEDDEGKPLLQQRVQVKGVYKYSEGGGHEMNVLSLAGLKQGC